MDATIIAIQAALSLIASILPEFGVASSSAAGKVIAWLEGVMPSIASLGQAAVADVQSIIASLQNSSANLTAAQLSSLDAMLAQSNAAFEAAATADGFPTPGATGATGASS